MIPSPNSSKTASACADMLVLGNPMLHGAGIFTCMTARRQSPSHVGKYTSTMVRIWV